MTEWHYRPLSVYRPFHASGHKDRLLVGGLGSGKTIALCADAISTGLRVPGLRTLMTRKTVPELRDTLEPEFINTLPPDLWEWCLRADKVRRSGGHITSIEFPNGSEFLFRSIDDWQKYKSLNLGRIYWDELSEFDQATYFGMTSRLRQKFPTAAARRMGHDERIPEWVRGSAAASNPHGHDWMWEYFVKEAHAERRYWTATSLDNPHLPEDYIERLLMMPPQWVKRYVLCGFDDFGGLIHPTWGPGHVVEPPELNAAAVIWMGHDPGMRHPSAMLWVAVQDGRMIAIHEEIASDYNIEQWHRRVVQVEQQMKPARVAWRVADPNRINMRDTGTAMSLKSQWRRKGIHFVDGPSRYDDRIPVLQQLVIQGRFLSTRACPVLNDQMREYKWEDLTSSMKQRLGKHAETYGPEVPVKVYDDLVNCAEYLSVRMVPRAGLFLPEREKPKTAWQLESEDIRRQLARASRKKVHSSHADGIIV